jgi:DNA repair ATPase RecN
MKFIYKWLAIIGFLTSAYLYVKNSKSINKDLKTISKKANGLYEKFSDTIEKNKAEILEEVREFEKEVSKNKEFKKAKAAVEEFVAEAPERVEEVVEKVQKKVAQVKKASKPLSTGVGRIDQLQSFVSNKSEITIPEIRKHFSSVSERTLRRDMEKLENMGVVKQVGKTKNSFYRVL